MWINIDKNVLLEKINLPVQVTVKNSPYPVLSSILIRVKDGEMEIIGTNMETYVLTKTKIDAKDGEILVNGRKFLQILRKLHSKEISLDIDENYFSLHSKGSFYKFPLLDTKDFPEIWNVPEEVSFELDISVLKEHIENVSFACSKEKIEKKAISGINWNIENEKMVFIATDGKQLGISSLNLGLGLKRNINFAPEIGNLLPEEGMVNIHLDERKIAFQYSDLLIISLLIEGSFPVTESIIPDEEKIITRLTVNKKEILNIIDRLSVVSDIGTKPIVFNIQKEHIAVSSFSQEGEEAHEDLSAVKKGEDLRVVFSAPLLLNIFKHIVSSDIVINLTSETGVSLIKGNENKGLIYLLMPLEYS